MCKPEHHPLKVHQHPCTRSAVSYVTRSALSLLLLLQRCIDLVLKTKAELDGAQAKAAGFGEDGVRFAERLRNRDPPRQSRLQAEVDKLHEMSVICSAHLSYYPASSTSFADFIAQKVHLLQEQKSEEERLHACHAEFARRECSFSRLIHELAEGYPIMCSWARQSLLLPVY